jgi:hypothetical protein
VNEGCLPGFQNYSKKTLVKYFTMGHFRASFAGWQMAGPVRECLEKCMLVICLTDATD